MNDQLDKMAKKQGEYLKKINEKQLELRVMFWNKKVEKKDRSGRYAYHTLEDVENLVIETLKKEDPDKNYFYSIRPFEVRVYHKDIHDPIRVIEIPKDWFDKTQAGNVTIMSPEQRLMSQMTYAAREGLRMAFFIRSVHDVDKEFEDMKEIQAEREDKIKERFSNHIKLIEGIETQERIDGARSAISEDSTWSEEQKDELLKKLKEQEDKISIQLSELRESK